MQNSDFRTRLTSLYWTQTTPVVLCKQDSVTSTWITSLYGSQPSSVVMCTQNSDFRIWLTSLYGSQFSSVVLSTHNSVLSTTIKDYMGFSPHLWFCVCNTETLGLELQVIDLTCGFCMQNSGFWTRITSLCGSQTSPVIFCRQNSVPSIRNTSLHGSQPLRAVFGCKTAT